MRLSRRTDGGGVHEGLSHDDDDDGGGEDGSGCLSSTTALF